MQTVKLLLLILHISPRLYYSAIIDLPNEVQVAILYHLKPGATVHEPILTFPPLLLCVRIEHLHLQGPSE